MPGFLSPQTYKSTWLEYQTQLCDRINSQVAGTTSERLSVRELHEHLSRRPADAHLYNFAAQAHHNHFFWNTLSSNPEPMFPAANLTTDIGESFESLHHLRDELTDAALAMFGQGYVWLMKEMSMSKRLWILCTYNAGSPFPAAHTQRQTHDHATGQELGRRLTNPQMSEPQNHAGSFGRHSTNDSMYNYDALKALPILCLKVWEHQWLPDYGMLGKEAYVKNWWNRIDWDQVQNNFNLVPDDPHQFDRARMTRANQATPEGQRLQNIMNRSAAY